ncbi:replication protein [Acinetobacter lwoffii]|uniref:replication protein n=1 Tax=Acinetobacter lwoffii TaxID=28090 RepID=UPI000A31F694|nr:replication protein [Acinetobacter lwoffii]
MKSNLAHEPPIPQGQVVHFPKNERKAMSNKEERYTKMPNGLIDGQIMAQLNDKAFKCLMFVMRQTIGFDRVSHPIAITQFQKYCGIKKRDTVMSCIRDLEELGLIKVERTTGCLSEYQFTPDQYREKGLVPNEGSTLKGDGTSTTKRDGTSTAKGDGTSTVERDPIKETLKETFKENFKERNAQENSDAQVWNPNLETLSSILKTTKHSHRVSEILSLEDFQFHLGNFNTHHEKNFQLTDNQKHRKFAQWIIQEFERVLEKAERKNNHPSGYTRSEKPNSNLDVNTAWADQASQYHAPVDSLVHIPEDFV